MSKISAKEFKEKIEKYMEINFGSDLESGSKRQVYQAVLGAAKIVLTECTGSADQKPAEQMPATKSGAVKLDDLINAVCTPGGTTIEAVKSLQENDFEEIVRKGAEAAIEKSIAMSRK